MRLGIDYRLLASQANLVNRGIGRYTQQQLRHVLAFDGENEYLLLCPPGADESLVLSEIRSAPNVSMRFGPDEVPLDDPYDRRGLLCRAGRYQDWIVDQGVDVYHATAPFVMEQTAPPAFDACPMVATVYDVIPLIFPDAYLDDDGRRSAYAGAARLVRSATRLLAISDGTRRDAIHYLGFPRQSVDCAWPYAEPCFQPLDHHVVTEVLGSLEGRVHMPTRFALSVAALHHTKNLELLFAAYARLSPAFRRSLPLVVACHLDANGLEHIRLWAGRHGVAEDLVLTGYVSDEELAALYNRATLVVHPSRYEGFGLPVVEAMQCGAAVIATTASSVPEVAGGAAELIDPDDAVGLALAIEGLAEDPDRRRRMGELGRERASAFTPEALAANTLACYRAAVEPAPPLSQRPRAAVVTPVPPATGEASAHAGDLLDAFSRLFDVEVHVEEDGELSEALLDRFPVHHRSALGRGTVDAVVHNIDSGEPVAGASLAVVHSEVDRQRLLETLPATNVVLAPLTAADPCRWSPELEMLAARDRLGWGADRFVALFLGGDPVACGPTVDVFAGEADDADRLLGCDVVVDLAGEPRRSVLVRASAAGKPVIVTGLPGDFAWPATFYELARAADVATRLVALADDPDRVRRRSLAARRWYEGNACADRAVAFYREVTGGEAAGPRRPPGSNRLWEVEDGDATEDEWTLAMSQRALAGLGREARVLSLGAASLTVAFHLARQVGRVTAAGPWMAGGGTPLTRSLLVDPGRVTNEFEPARLDVRTAEVDALPYADATFDAVVAPGAVESVAEAARVVKADGLVVLWARARIHGPAGRGITPQCLLERVTAAGLEPLDPVLTSVSEATMTARRRFAPAVGLPGTVDDAVPLTVSGGAVFGLLHLTLRRAGVSRPSRP